MPNNVPASLFENRQSRLITAIQAEGLDALVLNAGPTLTYLTGLHFHLSERPVICVFSPKNLPVIFMPELEGRKVEKLPFALNAFPYGEDPLSWEKTLSEAVKHLNLAGKKIGVEPRRFRVLELRLLETVFPGSQIMAGENCIAKLRMHKDESELADMRQAIAIAQNALTDVLSSIKTGQTERQIASELTLQLLRNGSDPEMPFAPIVASGPNSANPHAVPTDRQLQTGDLLILDWGASVNGYFSDLTRTFVLGEPEPEFLQIAGIVREANTAARKLAKPGIPAGHLDRAAREVIEKAGYGEYFTHRTGHGLGMEGHEEPYIRGESLLLLAPGMTFTIEPGIYLPGRGGVRIEDNLAITESGSETLTTLSRELVSIQPS
jgi:Xaa-Pro dipeptidase